MLYPDLVYNYIVYHMKPVLVSVTSNGIHPVRSSRGTRLFKISIIMI